MSSKGYDDGNKDWDDKKKEVNLHWAYLFSNLIAQWSQWLGIVYVMCNQ